MKRILAFGVIFRALVLQVLNAFMRTKPFFNLSITRAQNLRLRKAALNARFNPLMPKYLANCGVVQGPETGLSVEGP